MDGAQSDEGGGLHRVVAGVDGCRSGWVVATRRGIGLIPDLAVLVADATLMVIGVDMPIGLPARWGRSADREARRFVGRGRASSVFPVPPRSLLAETDYAAANRRSRTELGQGLPKQAFNLLGKIREVDALAHLQPPDRLVEVHPECSFRLMSGRPLPPKHSEVGYRERRRLLAPHFGPLVEARPAGAGRDDVLDALAVLWSTERFALGCHITHGDGEPDARGLPMRIVT